MQYQSFGKWQQKNHEWKYNLHLPRVISIAFAYESRKKDLKVGSEEGAMNILDFIAAP